MAGDTGHGRMDGDPCDGTGVFAGDCAERLPGPAADVVRAVAAGVAGRDRGGSGFELHRAGVDVYAAECAEKIIAAVKAGRLLDPDFTTSTQDGTLNFSACDRHGNLAALTLTHGSSFGAQVTVEGLGLTLGHGMSRFDPRPDHPNAPGPGKRPLNNIVPVIITKGSLPVVAIGGRKIPNAMFEFLTQYVVQKRPFADALRAPRLHTEGTKLVMFQKGWPKASTDSLAQIGYTLRPGSSATLSGVAAEDGWWIAGMP